MSITSTSLLWDNNPKLLEITSLILDPKKKWLVGSPEEDIEMLAPLVWGADSTPDQVSLVDDKIKQAREGRVAQGEAVADDDLPTGTPEEVFAAVQQNMNNWLNQEEVKFIQDSWAERISRIQRLIRQRNEARSAALAARAREIASQDRTIALNLAMAACAIEPIAEAVSIRQEILSDPAAIFYREVAELDTEVRALATSPDGNSLIAGTRAGALTIIPDVNSFDTQIKIRGHSQVDTFPPLENTPPDNLGSILCLAYSKEYTSGEQYFASGSRDRTGKIWNAATRTEQLEFSAGGGHDIESIAFSPTEAFFVIGSDGEEIKLWRIGEEDPVYTHDEDAAARAVVFSADGEYILSGWDDEKARLFKVDRQNPSSTEYLYSIKKRNFIEETDASERILSVAFVPSDSTDTFPVVTGSSDETAVIWEVDPDDEDVLRIIAVLEGHQGNVISIACSADGRFVITGSTDNTARVWDAQTGMHLLTLTGHAGDVETVVLSSDGSQVITASRDRTIKFWDLTNVFPLRYLEGHSEKINAVAISPDGDHILTGADDEKAKVWRASDGELEFDLEGHNSKVTAVSFSPNGNFIATGARNGSVMIWDASNGANLLTFPNFPDGGHVGKVVSVKFSDDSTELYSVSDEFVKITWPFSDEDGNATNSEHSAVERGYFEERGQNDVAFSPDESFIVTKGEDNTAAVWANPAKEGWENDLIYKLNDDERAKYSIDWEY